MRIVCEGCDTQKAESSFKKNSKGNYKPWCNDCIERNPDGYRSHMKSLTVAYKSEWRQRNIERINEKRKKWYESKRQDILKYFLEYRTRFADHQKARKVLGKALMKGEVRKEPCFICGSEKSEAHHPDYKTPLDVVWLCRMHHRQTHALIDPKTGALRD